MAFGGYEKIASGILLSCDRAGGTTFEAISGLVDIRGDDLDASKSEKTKQSSGGKREFLPSLRSRKWMASFRWDQVDATTAFTHAEMLADFIAGVTGNWRLVYPVGGAATTTLQRTALGFITEIDIPHVLGEVITASVTIQITGAITDVFI